VNCLHVKSRGKRKKIKQAIFPDNGIFGVMEGGPSQVVADGFYILTEPLTAGNHTVHYRSLSCPDVGCTEPAFAQDLKYNMIAKYLTLVGVLLSHAVYC
jgi:hypothetical protein